MLIEMGMRVPVLLLLAACSNDQFTGEDAATDAEAGGQETSLPDVLEASSTETGPATFCGTQAGAFFCDDFDTLPKVTDSFSVWTGGSIAFGAGLTGQGLAINAVALSSNPVVFVTEQVQGHALHEMDFAMQLGSTTLATYVRVTAGSSTFMVGVDGVSNFTIQGDSNSNSTLDKADTSWHSLTVKFENGKANVSIDQKGIVNVAFAASAPTSSSIDLGVVVGTLGGKVSFDDIVLR
jgi:hypothetical protein